MALLHFLNVLCIETICPDCYNQAMKLNADILYSSLNKNIPVEMTGYKDDSLTLLRPEFYDGNGSVFRKHHLYVTSGERISRRARCEKGAVVICAGEIPQMSYYTENCCFLSVRQGTDIFMLFNAVQEIWNRYDAWSDSLNHTLAHSASVEELVEASTGIFQNPVLVLDSHFHILAHAGYEGFEEIAEAFESTDSGNLSIRALDEFLREKEPLFHVREPMLLNIRETSTLSLNLFEGEEYTGSISVEYRNRPHESGDIPLLKYFSSYVLAAIQKNSATIMNDRNVIRSVFRNIIQGMPIDTAHRKYLEDMQISRRYICLVLRIRSRYAQIPVQYLIRKVDSVFSRSITFENRSDIISFVESDEAPDSSAWRDMLHEKLNLLVGTMDLKTGISLEFTDPFSARSYYLQALAALENGCRIRPEEIMYHFRDYVLYELISNAQADLPLDMYYPDGLRRLIEHDKDSSISYVDTLRTYLNNHMAVTKTARDLFIHRSTLLERLDRIRDILKEDLTDPDIRLQIQILLRALLFKQQQP